MSLAGRKSLPVCKACRLRKVKCDYIGGTCNECAKLNIECIRTSAIRFKHHHLSSRTHTGPNLTRTQARAPQRGSLRYHDETPEIVNLYHSERQLRDDCALAVLDPSTASNRLSSPGNYPRQAHLLAQRGHADVNVNPTAPIITVTTRSEQSQQSPEAPVDDRGGLLVEKLGANLRPSCRQGVGATDPIPIEISAPLLSRKEAVLLRNYADNMALWADGTDEGRSFETEATKRALDNPMLLYAICAFSSRHVNRNVFGKGDVALEYQTSCLQLLIPALADTRTVDEDVLAAVAILRQNEEMDGRDDFETQQRSSSNTSAEDDSRFHLQGVTRLLDQKSHFLQSGGLSEATAWLCLREDIYISLLTRTPIRSSLDMFHKASWLRGDSDAAWTNRMVLLLARLLSCVYAELTDNDAEDRLRREISDWYRSKPVSFQPIHYSPLDPANARFLPEIWMLASFHAVGVQYYHIAQLVMVVSACRNSWKADESSGERELLKQQMRHHLLHVVALASSTARAENTWFTAHHCLAVWGGLLWENGEQLACLDFLRRMENQTGWRMGKVIGTLERQWGRQ